ncbi:hypothetical protein DPMN_091133 [Dreissena polymorpha]|uniref:Uncharacterized protein n=1 Tax=Dreissena polymorpha TaxID=45954 RepID=A0A9D4KZ12_DREPO|nr:hypothetical protein DPMN_091133 [Dreissena polymorpha]
MVQSGIYARVVATNLSTHCVQRTTTACQTCDNSRNRHDLFATMRDTNPPKYME